MFFRKKFPIDNNFKQFIDSTFINFEEILGHSYLIKQKTILPCNEYFPNVNIDNRSELIKVFNILCEYMKIEPESVKVCIPERDPTLCETMYNTGNVEANGVAGSFVKGINNIDYIQIGHHYDNPINLIATIVHELSHVKLSRIMKDYLDDQDMELITDLFTIYSGFGIFTLTAIFQYSGHTYCNYEGWQTTSLGYLSLRAAGYALALYAFKRNEMKPIWLEFVPHSALHYFKHSIFLLQKGIYENIEKSKKTFYAIPDIYVKWRGTYLTIPADKKLPLGLDFTNSGVEFDKNIKSLKWETGIRFGIVYRILIKNEEENIELEESVMLLTKISEENISNHVINTRSVKVNCMQLFSCVIGDSPVTSPGLYRFKLNFNNEHEITRDFNIIE
ncbi:MAG: hypothetical protein JEY96_19080 [Bacteroidales bacterium]|nr:hypothetical protein [Bacteroidales bacterium]